VVEREAIVGIQALAQDFVKVVDTAVDAIVIGAEYAAGAGETAACVAAVGVTAAGEITGEILAAGLTAGNEVVTLVNNVKEVIHTLSAPTIDNLCQIYKDHIVQVDLLPLTKVYHGACCANSQNLESGIALLLNSQPTIVGYLNLGCFATNLLLNEGGDSLLSGFCEMPCSDSLCNCGSSFRKLYPYLGQISQYVADIENLTFGSLPYELCQSIQSAFKDSSCCNAEIDTFINGMGNANLSALGLNLKSYMNPILELKTRLCQQLTSKNGQSFLDFVLGLECRVPPAPSPVSIPPNLWMMF